MKGQIRPPGALKPLNAFRWNLEYITMSWVGPHTQIHVALWQRGWSGRTRDMSPVWFLVEHFFSFYFILGKAPHPHPSTDFNDLNVIVFPRNGVLFCGPHWNYSPFWGSNPTKALFLEHDSNQILYSRKHQQVLFVGGSNTRKTNPKMKNRKMAISPERFDRSAWNLARWRILGPRIGCLKV